MISLKCGKTENFGYLKQIRFVYLTNFNGECIILKTKLLKVGLTTTLIVFISDGILFGTIKMIDGTQTESSACVERIRPGALRTNR